MRVNAATGAAILKKFDRIVANFATIQQEVADLRALIASCAVEEAPSAAASVGAASVGAASVAAATVAAASVAAASAAAASATAASAAATAVAPSVATIATAVADESGAADALAASSSDTADAHTSAAVVPLTNGFISAAAATEVPPVPAPAPPPVPTAADIINLLLARFSMQHSQHLAAYNSALPQPISLQQQHHQLQQQLLQLDPTQIQHLLAHNATFQPPNN